ncbi:hypothetical protein Bcon01_80860 [Burkholderia contaminans]|nr:hypothetical protein Bcon01_80860 [Burkholderia contaminans]
MIQREAIAQQRQRMPAEREAHRSIVRHDLVTLRCPRQCRRRVVTFGAAQQISIRHGSGSQPERVASVIAGERAKCVRTCEHLQVVPIKRKRLGATSSIFARAWGMM